MSYDSDNHIPYILGLTEAQEDTRGRAMTIEPGSTPGSDMAAERPEADTKAPRIRHSTLKRLLCLLTGHTWTNDTTYPTYGYHDIPYPGSYCKKCGQQA